MYRFAQYTIRRNDDIYKAIDHICNELSTISDRFELGIRLFHDTVIDIVPKDMYKRLQLTFYLEFNLPTILRHYIFPQYEWVIIRIIICEKPVKALKRCYHE